MRTAPLTLGILCHATLGGSGVLATELGMSLAERGHQVHFFCTGEPARFDGNQRNVFLHEVRSPASPLFAGGHYALALASKIATVGALAHFDLIHAHYAIPHATSALLAKQMLGTPGPAIFNTLHGTDVQGVGNDEAFFAVTRHSILKGDGISVPSESLKRSLVELFALPLDATVEVIPNFVNTQLFVPLVSRDVSTLARLFPRSRHFQGGPPPRVLMHSSNFRGLKRVADVLNIFASVQAQVPAVLLMVGEGPERAPAEAQAATLGISDSVAFLGEQREVVKWLQLSDVFLLPSEAESFGLAALEALSCGVPVIATRVGGLPELVVHGTTGFLHDVGDVPAMAEDALRLLRNPGLRDLLAREARAHAERHFGRAPLVSRYEDAYRRALLRRAS